MRTGTLSRTVMTAFSISFTFLIYPKPRIRYSTLLISIVSAPISRLLFLMALMISITETLKAYMASGFNSIWYSFTKPPAEATSDTPSAEDKVYLT